MGYFEMSKLALKWALTKPPTTSYPYMKLPAQSHHHHD